MNAMPKGSLKSLVVIYDIAFLIFDQLLRWAWLRPISLAFFIAMISSFSLISCLSFVMILSGEFLLNLIFVNIYDEVQIRRVITQFKGELADNRIEKIDLSQMMKTSDNSVSYSDIRDGLSKLLKGDSHLSHFIHQLLIRPCVFYVEGLLKPSTFQMSGSPSLIFLHMRPRLDSGIAHFILMHEFGHSAIIHRFNDLQTWFAGCFAFLFIALTLIRPDSTVDLAYVSCAIAGLWVLIGIGQIMRSRGLEHEATADLQAIYQIAKIDMSDKAKVKEARKVISKIIRQYYRKFRRKEQAIMLARISQLWMPSVNRNVDCVLEREEKMLENIRHTADKKPPLILQFVFMVAVIFYGLIGPVENWISFFVMLGAWLFFPLFVYGKVIQDRMYSLRIRLCRILNEKRTPGTSPIDIRDLI